MKNNKITIAFNIIEGYISPRKWKAIYRLLDRVSPLPYDCGILCGSVCCNPLDNIDSYQLEEDDLGIYLYPGENRIQDDPSWITWAFENAEENGYPKSWKGNVAFIKCNTPPICPREKRPLQCRLYPLSPYIDHSNQLHLILYPHFTPYDCPIIYNEMHISTSFKKANYTVWKHLIKDPLIYDLIKEESMEFEKDDLIFVYP